MLLCFLLLAQDAEVDGLVDRLGDADPEVREDAARKLERLGSRPLDALKKAAQGADPERRARAGTLAAHAARERVQEAREAEERPKKLKLLAKDVATLYHGTSSTDGALFRLTRNHWTSGTIFETVVDRLLASPSVQRGRDFGVILSAVVVF